MSKYCNNKFQKDYVSPMMLEWKDGRWGSQKQAFAVASKKFRKAHPRCKMAAYRRKSRRSFGNLLNSLTPKAFKVKRVVNNSYRDAGYDDKVGLRKNAVLLELKNSSKKDNRRAKQLYTRDQGYDKYLKSSKSGVRRMVNKYIY
jgi:hypothetical protein